MTTDILENMSYLALGSRLKRLAETLQAGAARALAAEGYGVQPSQIPLLAALDATGPMTVSEAVDTLGVSQPAVTRTLTSLTEMGLIASQPAQNDNRIKQLSLTEQGAELVASLRTNLWPHIHAVAEELASGPHADFLEQVSRIESGLRAAPLDERVRQRRLANSLNGLRIREYEPALAADFDAITRQWVSTMFSLEENDIRIIENPQEMIIDRGGTILFVEAEDLGIIGTCALMPVEGASFELTKMGVVEAARGRKAGDFLMQQVLERAKHLKMDELFLLTNRKCAAAIHLYEKFGFKHDEQIMQRFGARYQRCNVAMSYDLTA